MFEQCLWWWSNTFLSTVAYVHVTTLTSPRVCATRQRPHLVDAINSCAVAVGLFVLCLVENPTWLPHTSNDLAKMGPAKSLPATRSLGRSGRARWKQARPAAKTRIYFRQDGK